MIARIPVVAMALALATWGCGHPAPPKQTMESNIPKSTVALDSIEQGEVVSGFEVQAVYLDASGVRMGGRFVHVATGFELDTLLIESAPQAFLWVNTFPTSDKGEPHTQEHLLLGKGNKGRFVAGLETMSLASSSAFTMQWRTCYHFHTIAGVDGFWEVFESKLDGLLHPDYSDEEIRREVRNFGIGIDAKTGALQLEEKGTVYNEMVRAFESPTGNLWHRIGQLQYGDNHPLAFSAGGDPAAIREMTAEDIRTFHQDNYHLANMGMVASFPRSVPVNLILEQVGASLTRQGGSTRRGQAMTESKLPVPAGAAPGKVELVSYPHSNAERPGAVIMSWPPTLALGVREQLVLELFLENFSGDASTVLYKRLVDSKTRTQDLGATGVWSSVSSELGNPVYVGISGVKAEQLTASGLEALRQLVTDELARIAALPDGSPELVAFNAQLAKRITQTRRGLAKFMNSPPRFGFRGTGSGWMNHLRRLERVSTFEKSLTLKSELAFVERELAKQENIWASYLPRWKLLEVAPYVGASVADPEMFARQQSERNVRVAAELARLTKAYGTATGAETLARYKSDYDAKTAAIEADAAKVKLPGFIEAPPMTLDDELVYEQTEIAGVPTLLSTFESMTGGTIGIAFDLRVVPQQDLPYLAALASLLTRVGVVDNGVPVSYEQALERQREEILAMYAYVSSNYQTGRVELVLKGSGNDLPETLRALEWMQTTLHHPNWSVENLPRIRDVVDRMARDLNRTMAGAEEQWVNGPVHAYAHQDQQAIAHTSSFLTRAHDLHRLRWQLRAMPDDASSARALTQFLQELAAVGGSSREQLVAITKREGTSKAATELRARRDALPEQARLLADEALADLGQLVSGLPQDSLATDWRYLCEQILGDLSVEPAAVLEKFDELRRVIARRGRMRMFAIGSSSLHGATRAGTATLVASVPAGAPPVQQYEQTRFIDQRVATRTGMSDRPVFVALVNPDTQSGVLLNLAPGIDYRDREPERLLDYLTSNSYSGHGAHGLFMQTWGAGLAYSNGVNSRLAQGVVRYYAERCPELVQTLRFVTSVLREATRDDTLVDYALAQAFDSRVAASFEGRGEAMAADYADGQPPALIREFRAAVLAVRSGGGYDVGKELFERLPSVYGRVLPGYGPASSTVEGAVYFAIGPEPQLAAYEEYLRTVEGEQASLRLLYPRDYWVPRPTIVR